MSLPWTDCFKPMVELVPVAAGPPAPVAIVLGAWLAELRRALDGAG